MQTDVRSRPARDLGAELRESQAAISGTYESRLQLVTDARESGMTFMSIAAHMGISEAAVRAILKRAKS